MPSRIRRPRRKKKKSWRLTLLLLIALVSVPVMSWVFLNTTLCEVQRISIHGIRYGYPEDMLLESGIEAGINVFSSLSSFEESLTRHPLVQEAVIERHPPRSICIKVEEREPFAYLNQLKPVPVCREGKVLPEDRIAVELDLPLLTVEGDEKTSRRGLDEGLSFLSFLMDDSPALYAHVSELVVREGKPVIIYLRTPRARILLGDQFTRVSSNLLSGVLKNLEKVDGFYEVDLRFRDQAVVRQFGEGDQPSIFETI
jgi:hypothetical protein